MKQGFTLIELLVVITILAILAGAALPYVQGYVQDSRFAKAKSDLDEISRALAVYEMREGEYATSTIGLLTGRYLNKSSVDPWGQSYAVATAQGIVYSGGPDKNAATSEDNIIAYYTPPLALVSAKWVDSNQSGAIDGQSPADKILLSFSRKINNTATQIDGTLGAGFTLSDSFSFDGGSMNTVFVEGAGAGGPAISTDKRSVVLTIDTTCPAWVGIKSDTVTVLSTNVIVDWNATKCLSGQPATIIEQ